MLESAIAESLPCVIDADGMWSVLRQPELVRGSRWTVLTPNKPEYARLRAALGQDGQEGGAGAQTEEQAAVELARALGGPVLVRKGETDLVSDGERLLPNTEQGCPKRSGGQGDVLAGTIATLLSWSKAADAAGRLPAEAPAAPLLAAYTGCLLTRRFSAAAFAKQRRAMTAPDLIEAIGPVFEEFSPADGVMEGEG